MSSVFFISSVPWHSRSFLSSTPLATPFNRTFESQARSPYLRPRRRGLIYRSHIYILSARDSSSSSDEKNLHSDIPVSKSSGQKPEPSKSAETFWLGAQFELLLGILGILVCILLKIPVLGSGFTLTTAAFAQSLQLTALFSLLFWGVELLPSHWGFGIGLKLTDSVFRNLFERRSLVHIALFCMCVAMGEEFLFRSCLLGGLCMAGLPSPISLCVSAVIFGVLHAYSSAYVVLASIAGFLFGLMYLQSCSIFQPLVVHFLYDFSTIMLMKLRWWLKTQTNYFPSSFKED